MYFWIYHGIFVIILSRCCCTYNYLPSKPNGDLSIVCHVEFGLTLADKSHFGGRYTPFSTACSNTFKLNKRAKCLSLSINRLLTWMPESNSNLPTCAKSGLSLQHHRLRFQPSHPRSHLAFLMQLLKCDTDMVASYRACRVTTYRY